MTTPKEQLAGTRTERPGTLAGLSHSCRIRGVRSTRKLKRVLLPTAALIYGSPLRKLREYKSSEIQ